MDTAHHIITIDMITIVIIDVRTCMPTHAFSFVVTAYMHACHGMAPQPCNALHPKVHTPPLGSHSQGSARVGRAKLCVLVAPAVAPVSGWVGGKLLIQ